MGSKQITFADIGRKAGDDEAADATADAERELNARAVAAFPIYPKRRYSCPFCWAPPREFRVAANGGTGCSRCGSLVAVDAPWYRRGEKINTDFRYAVRYAKTALKRAESD
jgi:hypothetical protein